MSDGRDQVGVTLDAFELGPLRRVGTLTRERSGAKSVISFAYDPEWIGEWHGFPLDPALPLYQGEQYLPALPGILGDAAPDRWGRTLLERRESLRARRKGRRPRHLDDWDFLLGVNDLVRMGAVRLQRDGAFLDGEPLSVPPLARLRELGAGRACSRWGCLRRRPTMSAG